MFLSAFTSKLILLYKKIAVIEARCIFLRVLGTFNFKTYREVKLSKVLNKNSL